MWVNILGCGRCECVCPNGDSRMGFDLSPMATLRWNAGVHNFMVYATGDIPTGTYDSTRLANWNRARGD
jgi:hypothetical protein